MIGILDIILIAAFIGIPILVTFLYSRFISPLHKYERYKEVPKSYKILVVICGVFPVLLNILFIPLFPWADTVTEYFNLSTNMLSWTPLLILAVAFIMNTIAIDAILYISKRAPIANLIFIPLMISFSLLFIYIILTIAFMADGGNRYY